MARNGMKSYEQSRNRIKKWCETGVRRCSQRERRGNEEGSRKAPFIMQRIAETLCGSPALCRSRRAADLDGLHRRRCPRKLGRWLDVLAEPELCPFTVGYLLEVEPRHRSHGLDEIVARDM